MQIYGFSTTGATGLKNDQPGSETLEPWERTLTLCEFYQNKVGPASDSGKILSPRFSAPLECNGAVISNRCRHHFDPRHQFVGVCSHKWHQSTGYTGTHTHTHTVNAVFRDLGLWCIGHDS